MSLGGLLGEGMVLGEFSVKLFRCACNAPAECQVYMGVDYFSLLMIFFFFLLIDNPWIPQENSTFHVDMDPESKYSQS